MTGIPSGSAANDDIGEYLRSFDALVAEEERHRAAGTWTSAPRQLMDVLGLSRDEVVNCKVLAWALDPLARHGLGASVLRSLTSHLSLEQQGVERAIVETEVSRPGSRADVVVSLPGSWILVIEAKVASAEGWRQAERLERDWPAPAALVLLTREHDRRPGTGTDPARWTPMTWSWFVGAIERELGSPPASGESEAQASLRSWLASARRNL